MTILIIDNWPIFSAGIRHILAEEFGPISVTEARSTRASLLSRGPWDLALVSIDEPALNEAAVVIAVLKHTYPRQRIVAAALRSNLRRLQTLLGSSIHGAIAKESSPEELVAGVRAALHDARTRRSRNAQQTNAAPKLPVSESLSRREVDVLKLLAAGHNSKAIAGLLNLSQTTVSTYRARMLQKLCLKSTADLIRYAFQNQFAD